MQVQLRTLYRLEFIPLIVGFVTETARCVGAAPAEISDLSIAVEESAAHIVENYPGSGIEEQFEVICEIQAEGLQITFSNMGLPVNERGIPRFQADRPEENIDGLRFFLIEKMVDHFKFTNEGSRGWKTVLFKKIPGIRHYELTLPELSPAQSESAHEKLAVRRATSDDAPGIVELAYRTYRYSYTKDLFYYTDQLTTAIEQERVISFIALNPAGAIVGQMVIILDTGKKDVSEIGAVMIQPEYRRSMGLLQLIKTVQRFVQDNPRILPFCEVNLVTTHTLSQRVCGAFHFAPMGLKLSVHGQARFLGIEDSEEGRRESLLHAVRQVAPQDQIRLFVPSRHVGFSRRLFDNAGIPVDIVTPDDNSSQPADETRFKHQVESEDGYAVIQVETIGSDLDLRLKSLLFELESDGIKTVYVRIAAGRPIPDTLDHQLGRLRLFFSGWMVESGIQWSMLYTRLFAQRFDFNSIQLYDPLAGELRDYIETCFQETLL
ncbi:MAG: ATP-binding protein [Candidatus Delongbacteria bacterium]|nr:ATP-binding protein [Candidatus Delongbacteria bacterium]